MDTLGMLFGSGARVKILRLFLLNPLEILDASTIAKRSKVNPTEVRKEINILKKIGFLAGKSFFKATTSDEGSKKTAPKKRVHGVQLKSDFPLLPQLKGLVISETPLNRSEIANRFRGVGKIKFLAISGIFIDEPNARVDVLVVGDGLKKRLVENALHSIEAEIGKELSYGVLETSDFLYRVSVYDKFVRDVLDFRHDRVIDKLGVQ